MKTKMMSLMAMAALGCAAKVESPAAPPEPTKTSNAQTLAITIDERSEAEKNECAKGDSADPLVCATKACLGLTLFHCESDWGDWTGPKCDDQFGVACAKLNCPKAMGQPADSAYYCCY
jgi:hypothetical protein